MSRWTLALCAALLPALSLAQVPQRLGYQGRLLKADGTPESGSTTLLFKLFDGSTEVWSETQTVALTDGYYAIELGDVAALPASIFNGHELALELTVNGTALSPRQRVASVPYAMSCTNLTGGTVNASSISVGNTPIVDSSGKWVGASTVSYSSGFSGSGTASSPLGIDFTSVQQAIKPAAGAFGSQLCPPGQALAGISYNGTAICRASGVLRGLWLFDEAAGVTASDSSGNENAGTLFAGTFTWAIAPNGHNGGAVTFTGNGLMEVPASASLDITDEITLEAWVNIPIGTTGTRTVVKREDAYGMEVALGSSGGTLGCHFPYGIGVGQAVYAGTVPVGSWVHLACTYDGVYARAYINDVLASSSSMPSGPLHSSSGSLWIGGQRNSLSNAYFIGSIDEVRITAIAKSFGGGNNGVPVGTVIASLLTETQIQNNFGGAWVLADGRTVTGSRYAILTGATSVPDLRGLFLRGKNNGRADGKQNPDWDFALGVYQADGITNHGHAVTDPGHLHQLPTWNAVAGGGHEVGYGNYGMDWSPYEASASATTGVTIGNTSAQGAASGSIAADTRPRNATVNYFIRVN